MLAGETKWPSSFLYLLYSVGYSQVLVVACYTGPGQVQSV